MDCEVEKIIFSRRNNRLKSEMTGVREMNISYQSLLAKMELELQKARQADGEQLRGHMYAVKALAELILEENQGGSHKQVEEIPNRPQITPLETIQSISSPIEEPLKTEDGANGDSLFDF